MKKYRSTVNAVIKGKKRNKLASEEMLLQLIEVLSNTKKATPAERNRLIAQLQAAQKTPATRSPTIIKSKRDPALLKRISTAFGGMVSIAKGKRGLSATQLAVMIGTTRKTVHDIEHALFNTNLGTAVQIASVLELDLNKLKGSLQVQSPTEDAAKARKRAEIAALQERLAKELEEL